MRCHLSCLAALELRCHTLAARAQPHTRKFHTVNGRQMHIYCSGAGSPTVLIETGAGATWLGWQGVQPGWRKSRVSAYMIAPDTGWSEPRSGTRDAETIVRELHALLDQAGVERSAGVYRPFLWRSSGAGICREIPAEIAGVVMIDSSSPQQLDEVPGERASYEQDKRDFARAFSGKSPRLVGLGAADGQLP